MAALVAISRICKERLALKGRAPTLEFDRLKEVTAPEGSPSAMARTVLVFAHPDEEVVAIGGRMARADEPHAP